MLGIEFAMLKIDLPGSNLTHEQTKGKRAKRGKWRGRIEREGE